MPSDLSTRIKSGSCSATDIFLGRERAATIAILERSDAEQDTIVAITRLAFEQNCVFGLNRLIESITEKGGTVDITDQVKRALLDTGIELSQDSSGFVHLSRHTFTIQEAQREARIDEVLSEHSLPKAIVDLISDYDARIEISPRNHRLILDILAGDESQRASLIEVAGEQGKKDYISQAVFEIEQRDRAMRLEENRVWDFFHSP